MQPLMTDFPLKLLWIAFLLDHLLGPLRWAASIPQRQDKEPVLRVLLLQPGASLGLCRACFPSLNRTHLFLR
jgi:hypothetical protein